MKRTFAAIIVLFTLALPAIAAASTWTIDPEHSYVGFKVRHLMVSNVKGNFTTFNGTVDLDDQDVARSKVTVNIDNNSIDTDVQKRDEHLRSADFLDVAKYPAMTFTSKKIARNGKDRLAITGDLTLHGVTRPTVWAVTGSFAGSRITGSARTRFKFADFNLEIPRLAFLLSVQDSIRLEYDFVFER